MSPLEFARRSERCECTTKPIYIYSSPIRTVNKPDADVSFKSSDGVLFALHRRNLATHAGGFPPPDTYKIINIPEHSETLELLLQFVYPPDVPELAGVPFALFMQLAYAAEKYVVYIAIPWCRMHALHLLRNHHRLNNRPGFSIKDELKSIVEYCLKHSCMNVVDEVVSAICPRAPSEVQTTIF
ncbi:hypothetical protein BDQ17DRAFT_343944 [Cyathus striatus]|nr:hypothetical protein BDQ17DRAFT_343944 [Cyathus striatus]